MALAAAVVAIVQSGTLQAQIDRIIWVQVVMAVGMAVVTLTVLALGVAGVMLAFSMRKLMRRMEQRAEPLLSAASKVAADATGTSAAVKERVDEVLQTVQELNGRLRSLATDAEERVREFGAVLQVVQAETREVLLDAAATARGVHTTAELLQGGRGRPPAPTHE
jgi:phosphate/sulfate permease